jgi:2,4-dienoyl-CoA reductase-like NADH-dependent reductase (Old Yellow Enzyme family)
VVTPEQEAYFQSYAAEIAQELTVPVITVGGNRDVALMAGSLNHTSIEYFALSRPLICEPNLIGRWQKGDLSRAKCVSCNKCFRRGGTRCIFNRKKPSDV